MISNQDGKKQHSSCDCLYQFTVLQYDVVKLKDDKTYDKDKRKPQNPDI